MGRIRLRRSDLRGPGIKRIRRGRGFSYAMPDGAPVTDTELLARIKELVIPPAWRNVWICPYPNGHVQAVGTDDAGRRQYLYHEQWRRDRDEEKHDRVLQMARRLPTWRESVAADLAGSGLTRKRVLAAALRMLDRGIFRTGGEEYAEENGTHGVATLLRSHAAVRGDECRFRYVAKGGLDREVALCDAELAAVVKSLLRSRSGSDRLLVHRERARGTRSAPPTSTSGSRSSRARTARRRTCGRGTRRSWRRPHSRRRTRRRRRRPASARRRR